MSELEGPHGSIRIQHRGVQNGKCVQSQSSMINDPFGPLSEHTRIMRKVRRKNEKLLNESFCSRSVERVGLIKVSERNET